MGSEPADSSRTAVNPQRSSTSSARSRRAFSRRRRVGKETRSATMPPPPPRHSSAVRTFSSTVSQPKVWTRWKVRLRPRRARPLDDAWVRSTPSSTTCPPLGLRIPETTSKSVVLPAPLGPMMPTTSPASAWMLTSLSATMPPKRTVIPAMSTIGPAAAASCSPRLASTLIPNDLPPLHRSWCGCARVCQSHATGTSAPPLPDRWTDRSVRGRVGGQEPVVARLVSAWLKIVQRVSCGNLGSSSRRSGVRISSRVGPIRSATDWSSSRSKP